MNKIRAFLASVLLCALCAGPSGWGQDPGGPARDDNVDKAYRWLVAQQESNRRLIFFTEGLLPSYEGGTDCFTYDQALAVIAFTSRGDLKKARQVLDFFDGTYRKEIKKYGKFIGFSDAYRKDGRWGETWAAGPNAWMLIAINHYTYVSKDTRYSDLAETLVEWLMSLQSIEGGVIGGYYGNGEPMTWISVEHNLDSYAAFRDLGVLTGDMRCLGVAKEIKFWMENAAWNKEQNRFNMGRDNPNFATDQSSWAVLALGSAYGPTLDFAIDKSLTKKMYKVNGVEIEGFDFGSTYEKSHYPDKDSIWLEGTAQMALAFDRAGRKEESAHFLSELDKALTASSVHKNASALPYATNEGTTAYGSWVMQDRPLCISSTCWYIFAKEDFNPFSMGQDEERANKIVDSIDYKPAFQFVPVIDDFTYGSIKFETAYPSEMVSAGHCRISRKLAPAASSTGKLVNTMKITIEPEESAKACWGTVSRPFLCPQDWGKYGKLNLELSSSAQKMSMKVKAYDREGEPFESIPIYLYGGELEHFSLDLKDGFRRSPELQNYGNGLFDREGVRKITFEVRVEDCSGNSAVNLHRIYLN